VKTAVCESCEVVVTGITGYVTGIGDVVTGITGYVTGIGDVNGIATVANGL